MEKAQDARIKNDKGSMKDAAALKATNLIQEYMDKKYVTNQSLGTGVVTAGDYVASQIVGTEGGFTYAVSGTSLTVTDTKGNSVTGIILDNGNISWGTTTPTDNEDEETGTTVADITASDYGTYVNLGTNLLNFNSITLSDNTHPKADWRVFYKDEGGVWLILAGYLPVDSGTGATVVSNVGLETDSENYGYSIWSGDSREDLITRLSTGNWSGLIAGSDLYENNNLINNNIAVKGTVDLETWVNSWNATYPSDTLYTTQTASAMSDGLSGYYIGDSENPDTNESYEVDLSSKTGHTNTLYFPHQSGVGLCEGYWLASPSAYGDISDEVMFVDAGAALRHYRGNDGYDGCYWGVRSAVYLPSSISLDMEGDVWSIEK